MREFVAEGRYTIQAREVVVVRLDRQEEREGLLRRLQAEGVKIDGVEVVIDGVESFAVTPLRKGMEIGLRLVGWILTPAEASEAFSAVAAMEGAALLDEPGSWNVPAPSIDAFEKHTVDIDAKRCPSAQDRSRGAIWAWVAMFALVALYCIWRWWR